ncbi:unnamed protein product [Urochloa humidicola]
MAYRLLPALRLNDHYARICVRVTRKWEYRGPADDGPVLHADLVVADHEGNSMYAEIPQDVLANYNEHIQEGHIYEISRFRVAYAKSLYNAVDARFMIYFTVHTHISNPANPPTTYPRYTYRLTPFEELPMVVGNITKFVDVLGIIVEISEVRMLQPSHGHAPAPTKNLILRDANGQETPLTIWGQRAMQFNVNGVYNNDDPRPIITLFVGCLMKSFEGQDYLSGSSACKWYFNPDITDVPEAEEFYNRYAGEQIQIRHAAPAPAQVHQPLPPPQPEIRYLQELLAMDPYEFPQNGCRCTVTIARLVPDVSWWFHSCVRCGRTCTLETDDYVCRSCSSKNYRYKYKLLFVASDGTAEAEMICFGQVAQRIIGKPVEQVLRTVRRDEDFPPDIAGVVSQKYTFVLTITNQSFYTRNRSFMVNSIIASYGRQRAIPQAEGSSSSRRLPYPRGTAPSTSARNNTSFSPRHALQPTMQHHTPPRSPASIQTSSQDAPPLDLLETPTTHSTKRKLACDSTEIEEESDDANPKRARFTRMKGAAETSEDRSARKRLTYDDPDPEEQSDDENKKTTDLAKKKGITETSEDQSAAELPRKRSSPERNKTSGQKSTECKTPRPQKNK